MTAHPAHPTLIARPHRCTETAATNRCLGAPLQSHERGVRA